MDEITLALGIIAMVIAFVGGVAFIVIAMFAVKATREFSDISTRVRRIEKFYKEVSDAKKKFEETTGKLEEAFTKLG